MNTRWRGRRGSVRAWPLVVAVLVGVAAGMALPRPFEAARAAQLPGQPTAQQQPPAFPGTPGQRTDGTASLDETAAADEAEPEPTAPIATRIFDGPAAMVLNYVRSGSTASFESLTRRLVEALAASEDGEHQALAAGWTMYRVQEPGPNNNALYVWLFDPVVANANYAVPQLLNELFPADVQQLYETYVQSFGLGQTPLVLEPVELVEDPG
jgi:hypothetical protein